MPKLRRQNKFQYFNLLNLRKKVVSWNHVLIYANLSTISPDY